MDFSVSMKLHRIEHCFSALRNNTACQFENNDVTDTNNESSSGHCVFFFFLFFSALALLRFSVFSLSTKQEDRKGYRETLYSPMNKFL